MLNKRSFVPAALAALFCVYLPSAASAQAVDTQTADLSQLATDGRFDDVLNLLRDRPEAQAARAQSLIASLERFRENQAIRTERRESAYRDALQGVKDKMAESDLETALEKAIEAHSIADDPAQVLADPVVVDLVSQTDAAAKQAEADEDWVEAAVLFGRLNLLYDQDARYRPDTKRIGSHLRLLALYHPESLRELQAARAKRVGKEDELNRARPEDETWQNRLSGINAEMLRESIQTSSDRHIDHGGYPQLLAGAIEPLLILLDTPSLAETFPGLADAAQVASFRTSLEEAKAALIDPKLKLTQFRAESRIDQVLANNRRTVNLPEAVIAYEMTEGALGTLDDFSSMYWPEDIDYLSRSTSGKFPGIGVQIARREGKLTVVSPLNGTPAQKAGLKAGDVIAIVDGADTSSWSLTKAVANITGEPDTPVRVTIERPGTPEAFELDIVRQWIEIESVKGWAHDARGDWDYWIDKDAGIGYIRLTQFIPQSVDKIDMAVARMRDEGQLNSLILDLRHNPGGLLTSAIKIVDRFLEAGPILYTVNGERSVQSRWSARKRSTYPDFELVILINQGSASASEIVSGALQDRGRALIVGDRSYGKGSVQDVYWYPAPPPRAKYGLKVTTQYYQLPGGRIIHRKPDSTVWGIDPDLAVEVTDQTVAWNLELRQEIDVLRDKGVETIETLMTRPWVKLAGLEPVDADADNAEDTVDVRLPHPDDLLNLGLDPQLEAALLVLKTKQVADDIAVAGAGK